MAVDAACAIAPKRRRCPQCDAHFTLPDLQRQHGYCPRCDAHVASGRDWSIARLAAMAVAMLVLMPFAYTEPLINIRLFGVSISASLLEGIWQITRQGHPLTASMVAFCTIGAPLTLVTALLYLFFAPRIGMNLRPALLLFARLKEWVMLDVYLVGMAVSAIKVREFSEVLPGQGLLAFIAVMLLSLLTLIHLNPEQLWQRFYPQRPLRALPAHARVCLSCHFTSAPDGKGRCQRCHVPLTARRPYSLQNPGQPCLPPLFCSSRELVAHFDNLRQWRAARRHDTVGHCVAGQRQCPVAVIVFIASILVPFFKVLATASLLLSIHAQTPRGLLVRMRLLRAMRWVGRWSMLDLFVIALTMSLVNRDQLLAFTMGPAAFYFGAAVVLTILSVEWLDSRLMWDNDRRGTKIDAE
ncbi:Paraquat-inducible protein A [Dickeya aquatica]|uniref:Paraquat-inducible protein A n=1 Tax=Dickeya aquatica TaxID=1401087 RepID=A0A375ABH2_9GAMM|nr:Paraquat-inducible protein A [Dickeya aquatica]